MNKRLILKLAAGVLFVASVFGFWLWGQQPAVVVQEDRTDRTIANRTIEDRTPEQGIVRAILEVPGLSYKVLVPKGSTAYDLMKSAASQYDDFSFKGKEFSGLGFFVEEINGLSQNQQDGVYWIYYINGETAKVGVSQYKIKENDVITWKYEKEH